MLCEADEEPENPAVDGGRRESGEYVRQRETEADERPPAPSAPPSRQPSLSRWEFVRQHLERYHSSHRTSSSRASTLSRYAQKVASVTKSATGPDNEEPGDPEGPDLLSKFCLVRFASRLNRPLS